jgi:hypothetical protein
MCFVRVSEQEAINSVDNINRLVSIAETEFTARYKPNLWRQFRLIFVLKRFSRQYRSINALYSSSNARRPYQKDKEAKPGNFQNSNVPSEVENQWKEKHFQLFTPVRKIAKSDYQLRHGCSSIRPSARNNVTERVFIKFDSWVFFENLLRKSKPRQNLTRITDTLHEDLCTFKNLSLNSS